MIPLISCLTVTLPVLERMTGLKLSIGDFLRQTHSAKELIIVMNGGDPAARRMIAAYVAQLQRPEVNLVDVPGLLTLGALRNISLREGRGAYFCQWDDDDRHHPERLASQLQYLALSGKRALCLEEVVQFFPHNQSLFCLNWRATEPKSFPGTLFAEQSVQIHYPEDGEVSRRGEDNFVIDQLLKRDEFCALPGAPHLYVYISHGRNTWPQAHHLMLAEKLSLSKGLLKRREAILREGLAPFNDFLKGAAVCGSNGIAFAL